MKTKIINVLGILAIVLAIAVLVVVQTQQELEAELAQLENELNDAGYAWLSDYSGGVDE